MRLATLIIALAVMLLSGCTKTSEFSPKPEMSGKDIFNVTCIECHKPKGEHLMVLSAEMKDADRIANQVLTGQMGMPAYPNIQGESAKKLAEYVLENSKFE
jgi:cytochrome c551